MGLKTLVQAMVTISIILKELNMASVGSSDDHFNMTIGTTVTGYTTATLIQTLYAALQAKATRSY